MFSQTWKIRVKGLRTVAGLELKQRIRSKRLYVLLGLWLCFHLATAFLAFGAASFFSFDDSNNWQMSGSFAFGMSGILTIVLLILVLPAMSAGAINGDKNQGTFAVLQATALSPAEIVLGKILAGWMLGLGFIILAYPILLFSGFISQVSLWVMIKMFLMMAFLALAMVMIGVGFSALTKRQLASVVLSFAVAIGATGILPIFFALGTPLVQQEIEVTTYSYAWENEIVNGRVQEVEYCEETQELRTVFRTDYLLGLLAVNPVVMVADMSSQSNLDSFFESDGSTTPNALQGISYGMRYLAQPLHPAHFDGCQFETDGKPLEGAPPDPGKPENSPVWHYGVLLWGLGAVTSMVFAVMRSRTPVRRLPNGHRIA